MLPKEIKRGEKLKNILRVVKNNAGGLSCVFKIFKS